jgi:hypothetical protein
LARVVLVVVGATLDVVVDVVVDVDVDVVVWADAAPGTRAMTAKRTTYNDLRGRLMFPPSLGVLATLYVLSSPGAHIRQSGDICRSPAATGQLAQYVRTPPT